MSSAMFDLAPLVTQIRMIVVWYWDEDVCDYGDTRDAVRGVKLAQKLVEGKTEKFTNHDWWIFADSLGSVDLDKYPEIAALHELANKMFYGTSTQEK